MASIEESVCCRYFDVVILNLGNFECVLKNPDYMYYILVQLDWGKGKKLRDRKYSIKMYSLYMYLYHILKIDMWT